MVLSRPIRESARRVVPAAPFSDTLAALHGRKIEEAGTRKHVEHGNAEVRQDEGRRERLEARF